MKIAVQTSLPAFQNDIGDVVRLFYGEGAAVEETQQARNLRFNGLQRQGGTKYAQRSGGFRRPRGKTPKETLD